MAIKTYTKGQKNQLSKNFVSTEFDCQGKECCSSTKVDEKLITYLDPEERLKFLESNTENSEGVA